MYRKGYPSINHSLQGFIRENLTENKRRKPNYSEKYFKVALVSATRYLHYQSKYIYLSVASYIKALGYAE